MPDDTTNIEYFETMTNVDVSFKIDSEIENDGSYDNPLLDMDDREKSFAKESGDVHAVYAKEVLA